MKTLLNLPILGLGATILLNSCGAIDTISNKLNQPISDTGFNPLDKPGMKSRSGTPSVPSAGGLVNSNGHGFNNGDIVEVVIPNTALFAKVPKAGDRYKKVLKVGETLNVVGGEKDFIKVVTESGETGYVSSVMVVTQGFLTNSGPGDPSVTEVGANETPIVPDIAPEPLVKGIGDADPAPNVAPAPIPGITAPVPMNPDPGLTIPDVPTPAPSVPDPTPVVPSLPDAPAPAPANPGIQE